MIRLRVRTLSFDGDLTPQQQGVLPVTAANMRALCLLAAAVLFVGVESDTKVAASKQAHPKKGEMGQWTYNYTSWSTALREHLLGDSSGYDKVVVPTSTRRNAHFESGTDVAMQVRFFKVDFVDSGTGSMQIKIWLRLAWQDSRLSWNPDQWGGLYTIEVNSPELEETEVRAWLLSPSHLITDY